MDRSLYCWLLRDISSSAILDFFHPITGQHFKPLYKSLWLSPIYWRFGVWTFLSTLHFSVILSVLHFLQSQRCVAYQFICMIFGVSMTVYCGLNWPGSVIGRAQRMSLSCLALHSALVPFRPQDLWLHVSFSLTASTILAPSLNNGKSPNTESILTLQGSHFEIQDGILSSGGIICSNKFPDPKEIFWHLSYHVRRF